MVFRMSGKYRFLKISKNYHETLWHNFRRATYATSRLVLLGTYQIMEAAHVNESYSGIIGELVEDDVALVIDDRVLTRLGVGYVIDVHMKYIR